jgi:GT2 family glycosyltransferase
MNSLASNAKVGCLITNYESWEWTALAVGSVLNYRDRLVRCVIVDDYSQSTLPKNLPLNNHFVHFHRNAKNLGYVKSVNIGFKLLSDCDIVILLDCDSRLLMDPIPGILRRFQENQRLGALAMHEAMLAGSARIAGELEPVLTEFVLGQWASAFFCRFLQKKNRRFIAHSSSLAIRRAAFEAVHGFDESFDFLDGDVDFSMRLLDAGWRIEPARELRCFHKGSGSPQSSRERVTRFHRNRFHLLKKHGLISHVFPVQCLLAMRHLIEILCFAVMYTFRSRSQAVIADKISGRAQLLRSVWSDYAK